MQHNLKEEHPVHLSLSTWTTISYIICFVYFEKLLNELVSKYKVNFLSETRIYYIKKYIFQLQNKNRNNYNNSNKEWAKTLSNFRG